MAVSPPRPRTDRRDVPPPRGGPSVRIVLAWVLLAVPFVALLWVSSYARRTPELFGFPFFFWYQLMWVLIAAALTVSAYVLYRAEDRRRRAARREGDKH